MKLVREAIGDVLKPISPDQKFAAYTEKYGATKEQTEELYKINEFLRQNKYGVLVNPFPDEDPKDLSIRQTSVFLTGDADFRHLSLKEVEEVFEMYNVLGYKLYRLNLHSSYLNYSTFVWKVFHHNNQMAEAYLESDAKEIMNALDKYSTDPYKEPAGEFKQYQSPNYSIEAPNSNLSTDSITYQKIKNLYNLRK